MFRILIVVYNTLSQVISILTIASTHQSIIGLQRHEISAWNYEFFIMVGQPSVHYFEQHYMGTRILDYKHYCKAQPR